MKYEIRSNAARSRALSAFGVGVVVLMLTVVAHSENPVGVPDRSFPESVTSTKDGTLYVCSFNNGGIVKVVPGGKA